MTHTPFRAALIGFWLVFPLLAQPKPPLEQASLSVRALDRLQYEIRPVQLPSSSRSLATFVVRRLGDTNQPLVAYFELAGTAERETDYTRTAPPEYADVPGTILTGRVQTVIFQPGESLRHVRFAIGEDDIREPGEFIRLELVPAPENETQYRLGRRHCATVWILNNGPCTRWRYYPDGYGFCLEWRFVPIPAAFFTTGRCR